jgi:ribonuclease BN (tRNA processing enzyme)
LLSVDKYYDRIHKEESQTFGKTVKVEESETKNLLIDVGTTITHALHNNDVSYKDIDAIFITNLHSDHAGGVEWIAFNRYFNTYPEPFGSNNAKLYGHVSVLEEG